MERLVLVDGHAMVYRAYHAYPTLSSPSGQLVNAVYGVTALLLKTIDDLKPTYLAFAFDLPTPNFRHEAYMAYQGKRKAMDVEMKDQFEAVEDVIKAAGFPIFTAAGFEADDVIGTIATKMYDKVDEVVIVTGDRDILQLVNDKVKVYMPLRGMTETRMFGRDEVKEYLGIYPEQVVDYKALIGDSSDNYPGVPGIGPKTGIELIDKYETFENVFESLKKGETDSLKPLAIKKLIEGYESGLLSKQLAKIECAAPVDFDLEKAKIHSLRDNKAFLNKLEEFGFRSLIARVMGKAPEVKIAKKKKDDGQIGLI